MKFPSGAITTISPWGKPFGLDWKAIAKWLTAITAAAAEFGVPPARLDGHVVIESGGDQAAIQRNPSNGDSYGLLQVVPRWHGDLIRKLSGKTVTGEAELGKLLIGDPALALRCGAAILKDQYTRHGSWDQASSAFFLGNPDWRGADTVNGNTGAAYKKSLDGLIAEIAAANAEGGTPVPPSPVTPVFGKVPRPVIKLDLVDKPEGAGWSNYGPRDNLVAIVFHTVLGRASTTGDYFRRFDPAYSDGGHGYNALTDFGVCNQIDGPAMDGVILEWNDPNSNRSPWASGGDGPPNGDGPALLALCKKLGRNLNQITEAIEVSRLHNGDPVSNKCMDSIIKLTAWRVDAKASKNGTSYKTWPRNGYGTMMTITHAEMGKAGCNAGDIIDAVQRGVLEVLTFYQGKGIPVPPVVPVTTKLDSVALPDGITTDYLRECFGDQIDPNGAITLLWAQEAVATGRYPKLVAYDPAGTVPRRFRFEGGLVLVGDKTGARIARKA